MYTNKFNKKNREHKVQSVYFTQRDFPQTIMEIEGES
jgi:hypothetical protein